jgi:hypothetical protein
MREGVRLKAVDDEYLRNPIKMVLSTGIKCSWFLKSCLSGLRASIQGFK